MQHIHDPNHPAWPIIRLAVLMLAMTAVLWLTASNFDDTEVLALTGAFLAAGSVEAGVRATRRILQPTAEPDLGKELVQ